MWSDFLTSGEKKKELQREVRRHSNDDLADIAARDRLEQKDIKQYKEHLIPTMERTIAALEKENAVYRRESLDALSALERMSGIINREHGKIKQ